MLISPSAKSVTEKLHEKIADGYYKIILSIIGNDVYHQQKKYMQLRRDIYFDTLSREEVIHRL